MTSRNASQNGSVFFLILLGIVMFAAISYAVLNGSRQGTAGLSKDKANFAAQEIIAYGNAIQKAVATLRLRGCTMAQITFEDSRNLSHENSGYRFDYANPNSPADGSCHVFGSNGGKATPQLLSTGFVDPALIGSTAMAPDSFRITMIRMKNAGSDDYGNEGTDVVLWIGRLKPEVCLRINEILGVQNQDASPPVDTYDSGQNTWQGGGYGNGSNPLGDNPLFGDRKAFCSGTDSSGLTYTYYQLLYAR